MKGQKKIFLTSWPHGKLVCVEVIERKPNVKNAWYIRCPDGGTDTTFEDFLFDMPVIKEIEESIEQ